MTPTTRRSWWFFIAMPALAFGLNWLWEMVQMPAFQEMAGRSWLETSRRCTIAALGDVAMILAIYAIGAVAAGDARWGTAPKWIIYATEVLLGAGIACAFEWFSLATGRWTYNEHMPVIPGLRIGLWPLLQLALLAPLSYWLAHQCIRRLSSRDSTTCRPAR